MIHEHARIGTGMLFERARRWYIRDARVPSSTLGPCRLGLARLQFTHTDIACDLTTQVQKVTSFYTQDLIDLMHEADS